MSRNYNVAVEVNIHKTEQFLSKNKNIKNKNNIKNLMLKRFSRKSNIDAYSYNILLNV